MSLKIRLIRLTKRTMNHDIAPVPTVDSARAFLQSWGRLDPERFYTVETYDISLNVFRDFQNQRGYAIYFEGVGQDAYTRKAITTTEGQVLSIGLAPDSYINLVPLHHPEGVTE